MFGRALQISVGTSESITADITVVPEASRIAEQDRDRVCLEISRRPSTLLTEPPSGNTFNAAANRIPGSLQEPVHEVGGFCRG